MTKFLLTYHGDPSLPDSQAEIDALMAAWGAWFDQLGDAVVDGGNPVGQPITLHPDNKRDEHGGSNPVTGYSIIAATDLADAEAKARGCPVLSEEGGSIQLAPIIEM